MDDRITQVKQHYKLPAIVAPYTGGLRAPQQTHWGNYMNGWCPWCQNGQKQPNEARRFWVNVEAGICNCFHPACAADRPMDVINFWARIKQITNQEAIRDLAKLFVEQGRQ